MFAFDWIKGGPWDPDNIKGPQRWLNDVWEMVTSPMRTGQADPQVERHIERKLHQTIKQVSDGLEKFSFNTSIAALMTLRNELKPVLRDGTISESLKDEVFSVMLRLMAPFTPHIAEELWVRSSHEYSIHQQPWPEYDAEKAREDTVALVIMVNGKPRADLQVAAGIAQDDAIQLALASDAAKRYLNGNQPRKVIFIPGRSGQEPKVNIVL